MADSNHAYRSEKMNHEETHIWFVDKYQPYISYRLHGAPGTIKADAHSCKNRF